MGFGIADLGFEKTFNVEYFALTYVRAYALGLRISDLFCRFQRRENFTFGVE
jgi:hypothetical protein